MKFSPKLLGKNENVVLHLRTHIKALIPHFLFNVLIIVISVLAYVYLPRDWRPTSGWVILAVAVTLLIIFGLWPWLNWLTSTYTVTNRRLITRTGVLTKTGHDIPLTRISDVSYEHSLLDRMFGCGTLVLQTSASDPLYLHDIPRVEKVHVLLTDMLFHSDLNLQDPYRRDPDESSPRSGQELRSTTDSSIDHTTAYPSAPAPEPAVHQPEQQPLPPVQIERPATPAPAPANPPAASHSAQQTATVHEREAIPSPREDPDYPLIVDDDAGSASHDK